MNLLNRSCANEPFQMSTFSKQNFNVLYWRKQLRLRLNRKLVCSARFLSEETD